MFGFNIIGTGFKAIKSNFDKAIYEYNNSAPEAKNSKLKKAKRSRTSNRTAKGRSKLGLKNSKSHSSVQSPSSGGRVSLGTRGVARGGKFNSDS